MDVDKIADIANEFAELTKDQPFAKMTICESGKYVQLDHLPDELVEKKTHQQWSEYQFKYGCVRNGVEIYYVGKL